MFFIKWEGSSEWENKFIERISGALKRIVGLCFLAKEDISINPCHSQDLVDWWTFIYHGEKLELKWR